MITVEGVSYGYTHRRVLKDIFLSVDQGAVVCLLGPNGSGKTTLLKLLLGFFRPQSGQVLLEGRSVLDMSRKQLARRMAYVPQGHRLSFGFRVMDVVLMGRMPHKPFFFQYGRADEQAAAAALERLGIAHLAERPYTDISGGERQLTLIARALVQGADIFIMDEPVTGLDYGNQIRLLDRIAQLARNGYTFIKTTHFPNHALRVSDRVVMLKEGQVIADGATRDVMTSENLYRLYDTPINVCGLNDGGCICVPSALKKPDHHQGLRYWNG